jgi:hypothetical protein
MLVYAVPDVGNAAISAAVCQIPPVGAATDPATTYPVFVSESEPVAFVAVNFTSYVPALEYVCVGFCAVESVDPELSKSHAHDVGVFVERSVNVTSKGALPESGVPEKSATGAAGPPDPL